MAEDVTVVEAAGIAQCHGRDIDLSLQSTDQGPERAPVELRLAAGFGLKAHGGAAGPKATLRAQILGDPGVGGPGTRVSIMAAPLSWHRTPTMHPDKWRSLSIGERLQWALSPDLPEALRPLLLREQWMQTRCYFSRRQDLRPDEVAVLAQDDDYVIRLCIAKRPDLTPVQISALVMDRDPNVRYAVARNALLSAEQRDHLRHDVDELVRRAAAKGPKASETRSRPGQAILLR